MPVLYTRTTSGNFPSTFNVEGPRWLKVLGLFERGAISVIRKQHVALGGRMTTKARRGYRGIKPLESSFSANHTVIGGLGPAPAKVQTEFGSSDEIAGVLEWGSGPSHRNRRGELDPQPRYMPPFSRPGRGLDTGINDWTDRHREPNDGYETGISAEQVRWAVYYKGTPAHLVVTKAWEKELPAFKALIIRDIRALFRGK